MTVSTPGSGERSPEATGSQPGGWPRRLARVERNVVAVSTAMFAMALGEQTWRRFLPKYLQTLGAPIVAIGAYGTAEDFLDGIYQYPGVWIADHYRRRRALLLFVGLAGIGYAIIAVAPVWPVVVLGLVFTMAWTSMASPSFFAVIGDALPLAFIVGGLREIGEPARKALIVDLAAPEVRARSIGLYYLIRSAAIAPAVTIGGLLWRTVPAIPFVTAGLVGLIGTTLFAVTVDERHAG
jgi:MFS family permease